ncbi:hypothetical protein B0H13DRAFT_1986475 [Mycena leptocephala]|nr:hypothetical protein B0H13DRAFT_1986475 [Mycena leptocephala]
MDDEEAQPSTPARGPGAPSSRRNDPTHRRTDRLPPPPPTHTPPPGIYSEGESEDFPLSLLDSRSNKRVTKVKVKKWVSPSKLEKREKERKEREEREKRRKKPVPPNAEIIEIPSSDDEKVQSSPSRPTAYKRKRSQNKPASPRKRLRSASVIDITSSDEAIVPAARPATPPINVASGDEGDAPATRPGTPPPISDAEDVLMTGDGTMWRGEGVDEALEQLPEMEDIPGMGEAAGTEHLREGEEITSMELINDAGEQGTPTDAQKPAAHEDGCGEVPETESRMEARRLFDEALASIGQSELLATADPSAATSATHAPASDAPTLTQAPPAPASDAPTPSAPAPLRGPGVPSSPLPTTATSIALSSPTPPLQLSSLGLLAPTTPYSQCCTPERRENSSARPASSRTASSTPFDGVGPLPYQPRAFKTWTAVRGRGASRRGSEVAGLGGASACPGYTPPPQSPRSDSTLGTTPPVLPLTLAPAASSMKQVVLEECEEDDELGDLDNLQYPSP